MYCGGQEPTMASALAHCSSDTSAALAQKSVSKPGPIASRAICWNSAGRLGQRMRIAILSFLAARCRTASCHRSATRSSHMNIRVTRLANGPIIGPHLHPSIGVNIQGPSLIRVPDWIEHRLGAYYLYFADHKGSYIRLAYADHVTGPWSIYPPGTLQLEQSCFLTEPPEVTPEQFAELEARWKLSGVRISHDLLS